MDKKNIKIGSEIICSEMFKNDKYISLVYHTPGTRYLVADIDTIWTARKGVNAGRKRKYLSIIDIERKKKRDNDGFKAREESHYRYHISDEEFQKFETKMDRVRRIINNNGN